MKRIGILTCGGDTPALNATLYGAVTQANHHKIEVLGFIKGFSSLFNPRVPHVRLNPLFCAIPELNPALGGSIIGASRDYVDPSNAASTAAVIERLLKLRIDGLVCVGGDGTLTALQALSEHLPCVLASKTIDNDLGLNYRSEPDEWQRQPAPNPPGYRYVKNPASIPFDLERMINYATPGYATAVLVSASGVQRLRTTAESHRRIAIIEVMGRNSGYLALGAAYGQPDIVLLPESPINLDRLVERVVEIYELQKNVVIVCAEGAVDEHGRELGSSSTDPAGNRVLTGAADALRQLLISRLGDNYFTSKRRNESASAAIFTRKVGHTQRGGRPIFFDRFYAVQLGGHAVDLLVQERASAVSILQWNRERGFTVASAHANEFRDRWGHIHARRVHLDCYDPRMLRLSRIGIEYLLPIFSHAIGRDDLEDMGALFNPGHLYEPFHSINVDVNKRIRFLGDG